MPNKQSVKALVQSGKWEEAKIECVTFCQLNQKDAEAWFLLGVIYGQLNNFVEAEKCCNRVITLSPSVPVAHFNLGISLQKLGRYDQAAKSFRRAISLNPLYAEAHNELGAVLHLGRYELDKVADCYRQALALKPEYAEAHYNLGAALRDMKLIVDAEAHFKNAIRLRPGMIVAYVALGQMYMSVGYLDEAFSIYKEALLLHPNEPDLNFQFAIVQMAMGQNQDALESFQHVLNLNPGNPAVCSNIAKLLEREGKYDKGYDLLRPFLASEAPDAEVVLAYATLAKHLGHQSQAIELMERTLKQRTSVEQCKLLHFALGKLCDEAQNYEVAFSHWEEANGQDNKKFDLQQNVQLFADLKSVFTVEKVSRRPIASNKSALPVFIVGMPRSGTSLVEQILASHPEVYGAGELHHIGNIINVLPNGLKSKMRYPFCIEDMGAEQADIYANRHLERLQQFSAKVSRVTDKMPHNFRHLGLIDMLFPGSRVIHCLRDPIDTCLSIYSLPFGVNHAYAADLDQLGAYYKQYQSLMMHWKENLRIPIMEVRYEDIIANQEEMTRKMVDFCELNWDERCLQFHEVDRVVTTPSYDQVRRPIYNQSVARWKNYKRHLGPLIDALGMEESGALDQ
ncbi:tetratricopeptide repeat-containing sulfotransferase family protein [Sulfurirhabdus autotrophica]|uniref:Tetratricopeptide (TPR) repeat protein n=1 Tax=Sulfurirhabdus autotrophica TaxID=1706046 RepID=A0A4R3XYK7_9PROT|nr:tetratricopeptide repeat-containing sulfotransferase family protein [Sulfurirhabdus autotrophica]TCV83398.1 tetratricopeptide (TPR) repeat protein [Sulfurirhabdus autotrophica]